MNRTLLLLCLIAMQGEAQVYRWVDADGRVHYGDRPPPELSPEQLRTGTGPDAAAAQAQREATARIRREADILERARVREGTAAARAAAERRELAAAAAKRCGEAREALRILQAGGGVYYEDAAGERAFISDVERDARIAELSRDLARHCGGAAP